MIELLVLFQTIPDFVHGEECLFCHRSTIGPTWQQAPHNITTRPGANPGEILIGARGHTRSLRKAGYNRLAFAGGGQPGADAQCAGCHTTAVDPKDLTYAYLGLDCFACHGSVDLEHSADTSKVLLSKKHRADVRTITSICAQCHLRGGKSKSTGRPYPNAFVAGADLFADYDVDLEKPDDLHIFRNVREVLRGESTSTCLACHTLHRASTERHRRAAPGAICNDCHVEGRPRKELRPKAARTSATCLY